MTSSGDRGDNAETVDEPEHPLRARLDPLELHDVIWKVRRVALDTLGDVGEPQIGYANENPDVAVDVAHRYAQALFQILDEASAIICPEGDDDVEDIRVRISLPTRPAPVPLLDQAWPDLVQLADVPWIDWTPLPAMRVAMMFDQLGSPPEPSDEREHGLWMRRHAVLRSFARELFAREHFGKTMDEVIAAEAASEEGDAHWRDQRLRDYRRWAELIAEPRHISPDDGRRES